MSPPLVLTMGDPAGIGPEICVKALAEPGVAEDVVVVGDPAHLRRARDELGLALELHVVEHLDDRAAQAGVLDIVPVETEGDIAVGIVSARAGAVAAACIRRAVALVQDGQARGLVTAPINKEALSAAQIPFPGHTEMLASLAGVPDVSMMLYNQELRVVLVSVHVALRDAIGLVTREAVLRAIRRADAAGRRLGVAHPRVAVAGLNPHAGENGLFGDEEQTAIAPAVSDACADGIDASGPWPGDTVFMSARAGAFDIVVAQYHDQGLIPVKYLGLDEGVNVTLGLPFVRTSVDHGTAFAIAGQGRASAASLLTAIRAAARLTTPEEG